jgi:hypothetical protein
MKRLALLASVFFALSAASCGGGGGSNPGPVPPPISSGFSNASLTGQYAFSMSGTEDTGAGTDFFARVGSFIADGQGHITSGLEDVNVFSGVQTIPLQSSTYSIGTDGRGTLQLVNSTGTLNFSISMLSTSQAYIIQTDGFAAAGGSIVKQDPTAFSPLTNNVPGIAGSFVFDFSGIDSGGNPESIVGRFAADGAGGISGGRMDTNIGGSLNGPLSFASASYSSDPANVASLDSFGRGLANIAGNNFVFYIVDGTRVMFLGTDYPSALVGEADGQQDLVFSNASLNGSYAFMIGGAQSLGFGAFGPIATAGRFTADGGGNLSALTLDENNDGIVTQIRDETGSSYTVDAVGDGRGTATFNTSAGIFTFVFYLMSPTQAVLQETDSSITSNGSLQAQTEAPYTTASLAGDYAFRWNGVSSDEEDFVGRLTLSNAGVPSGGMDLNEFATAQLFANIPLSGTFTLGPHPTGFNTLTVTAPSLPAAFDFTLYVVNPKQAFVVGTDSDRVVAGALSGQ